MIKTSANLVLARIDLGVRIIWFKELIIFGKVLMWNRTSVSKSPIYLVNFSSKLRLLIVSWIWTNLSVEIFTASW